MEVEVQLGALIFILEQQKGLYLFSEDDYSSIVNFMEGYNSGVFQMSGGLNLLERFPQWLKNQEARDFSMHWADYILREKAKGDEKLAAAILLQMLKQYKADLEHF